MTVEDDVKKNSADIQSLTVNMTRLAVIVENSEKRHDSDMGTIKEAVQGIQRLNERIGETIGMERDISAIKDTIAEKTGDIRTIRHDVNTILTALKAIEILNDKIAENAKLTAGHTAEIDALKAWRDRVDGATGAVKIVAYGFWLIFGSGIVAGGYFLIKLFVSNSGAAGGS